MKPAYTREEIDHFLVRVRVQQDWWFIKWHFCFCWWVLFVILYLFSFNFSTQLQLCNEKQSDIQQETKPSSVVFSIRLLWSQHPNRKRPKLNFHHVWCMLQEEAYMFKLMSEFMEDRGDQVWTLRVVVGALGWQTIQYKRQVTASKTAVENRVMHSHNTREVKRRQHLDGAEPRSDPLNAASSSWTIFLHLLETWDSACAKEFAGPNLRHDCTRALTLDMEKGCSEDVL